MNLSPCTPDEAEGFEHISDFLYPEGELDSQALGLFLKAYGTNDETYYYRYSSNPAEVQKQMHAMGLLLRLLDPNTPLWFESFQTWYSQSRMANAAYISAWFSFLDEGHKKIAKTSMLKMLAGAPSIDLRVALMMDGMEHYRDLPVQTFIGKSLLRVKSASFVKALKPSKPQMPMVLRMAKELKETLPEFSDIAQAITMGVFVQRMSEKPAPANPQSEYSACEAFLLVLDHGAVPPPSLFVSSAKSRFKGSSLLSDMMKFVSWALEKDPAKNWMLRSPSQSEKTFAAALMETLLDDILMQDPSNQHFDHALMDTHAVSPPNEELHRKMRDWFSRRLLRIGKNRGGMASTTFVYLVDHMFSQDHHADMWDMWSLSQGKSSLVELVKKYVQEGPNYYDSARYYELLRNSVSAADIVSVLHMRAEEVFNREKVMAAHNVNDRDSPAKQQETRELHFLRGLETFFATARRLVSPEVRQNESFKQLVSAASMAYLMHGGQCQHATYITRNGQFVNLLAEPLPLLRTLYPEHTAALNALRKDIIGGTNNQEKKVKNNYHRALYDILGRALYSEASVGMDAVEGMTKSMGLSVLGYFQACAMQQDVHFEVSGDVFEAGLF